MCRKIDFFSIYPLFIEVDIIGPNDSKEDSKDYQDFQGTVESRILKLLQFIIKQERSHMEEGLFKFVPFPKMFKKK